MSISVTDFPIPWKSLNIAILFDFHRSIASFVSQGWNHLRLGLLEGLIDANMALHGIKKHWLKRAQLRFPLPWCINSTNDSASSPRWLWRGIGYCINQPTNGKKDAPNQFAFLSNPFNEPMDILLEGASLAAWLNVAGFWPAGLISRKLATTKQVHFRGHFESLSLSDFQSQSCQDAGNISVTQTKN